MPLIPVAPPQPVPVYSGFDYVTVDAVRRRVYAAHSGSRALLIVDADSGRVLGQVRVGSLHGVAVDPATGHVFTGDGDARTVSEVDPVARKVLRSVGVDGVIDAVAYDAGNHHIYADEDDGTRIFVVDATAFKSIGTVALPGHKPEYLAVNPETHVVYQNITDLNEFVIVDGGTLRVTKTVPTPEVTANHPLQYDAGLHRVLIGGTNGAISSYDANGNLIAKGTMQPHVDQCSLDPEAHVLACAGNGEVTILRVTERGAPAVVARGPVPRGVHTVGIDPETGRVFVVWSSQDPASAGDFVQAFSYK
jgi:DNA-binding beta-propeller fold protein YncE